MAVQAAAMRHGLRPLRRSHSAAALCAESERCKLLPSAFWRVGPVSDAFCKRYR